jgi:hypothetical protein
MSSRDWKGLSGRVLQLLLPVVRGAVPHYPQVNRLKSSETMKNKI